MSRQSTNTIGKKKTESIGMRTRRFSKYFRNNWGLYMFAAPAIILLIMFRYVPMYGLQIAFKDYSPALGFANSRWIGFTHFIRFFNAPRFWPLLFNTMKVSFLSLIVSFPIPIIMAMMINQIRHLPYKKTVQMITYAPHFISVVVVVGMLNIFLSPSSGIINTIIKLFGGQPIPFMQEPNWFLPLYITSGVWQSAGWQTIIYLAALSSVSPELHESAIIDGASKFRRILSIDIPCIMPIIIIKLIMVAGNVINVGFEKVFLMQNDLNITATEVISTYVYKVGMEEMQYGFSSAVGLFNSVVNFIMLISVNKIARTVSETSLW